MPFVNSHTNMKRKKKNDKDLGEQSEAYATKHMRHTLTNYHAVAQEPWYRELYNFHDFTFHKRYVGNNSYLLKNVPISFCKIMIFIVMQNAMLIEVKISLIENPFVKTL